MNNKLSNKPLYKRSWFILLCIIIILFIAKALSYKYPIEQKNIKQKIEETNKAIQKGTQKKKTNSTKYIPS